MIKLNYPLNKGKLKLTNRLVMPPMATAKCEEDGSVSKEVLDYYEEKSMGGYISLIIIEHSFVTKQGKASNRQMSVADDSMIDGLKKLSDCIHKNGSKAVMQINHAGSATSKEITGFDIVAPSAGVQSRRNKDVFPLELSKNDIANIVECFKDAAIRVKKSGFDGVEIHSAHGYLLNQFFSPLTNKRNDEYGGDIYGRIKIHLDIIKALKNDLGEDYPILLRLGASDYTDGGTTIEDSIIAAQEFEKAGVEIIDISGGFSGYSIDNLTGQGYFWPLSEMIKRSVSIPVLLTGGITDPYEADKLLGDGKADLIGVGRAILNDSGWARKAFGKLEN